MIRKLIVVGLIATGALNQPSAQTKVACIGTSITQSGSYTRPLAQNLGAAYAVGNFGQNGTTILRSCVGWLNYTDTVAKVIAWRPNICTIELGANDAPPWGQHDACSPYTYNSTQVAQAYNVLIDTLLHNISPAPLLYVCLPTPNFTSAGVGAVLRDSVLPTVRAVALARNIPIIDNYTPCVDHPEYFLDGLHPNSLGGQVIATTIYQVISGTTASLPTAPASRTIGLRPTGSIRIVDLRGRLAASATSRSVAIRFSPLLGSRVTLSVLPKWSGVYGSQNEQVSSDFQRW
jgi:lysophospholipase L1-like esterase